ncbi:MAG: hypothetical protein PHU14_10890 [Methylovulum sp.]|nr:hypothetical protein [Methylovulum sp.]
MKKEILLAVISAALGAGATFGFDILKSKYLKEDDPLSNNIVELTHVGKELILEQKSLIQNINSLSQKSANHPDIQVELTEIINRVNNIIQTTIQFEAKSQDVVNLASSVKNANSRALYNANADLVIKVGQAVSVCGNENTIGVDGTWIRLNNENNLETIGMELRFNSPTAGPSLITFLGQHDQFYEFRVVCGTTPIKDKV